MTGSASILVIAMPGPNPLRADEIRHRREMECLLLAAEREHINELFRGGRLKDDSRRRIERELDLREAHFAARGADD
jgi:hypothetical protein